MCDWLCSARKANLNYPPRTLQFISAKFRVLNIVSGANCIRSSGQRSDSGRWLQYAVHY